MTVALVLAVVAVATGGPEPTSPNATANTDHDHPSFATPCGGTQVELRSARQQVPYRILLPEHPLADANSLESVWRCPAVAVLLRFRSGVTVFLDVSTIANPEEGWAKLAADDPSVYSTRRVQGVLASVTDPDGDPSGEANGGVTLVSEGTYISVGGNGSIPIARLIEVTESLQ